MFETLTLAPPDPILGLNEAFRQDPNPNKINLSVGVYKNAEGDTPILQCVKAAEQRLLSVEDNKSYLPIDGMREYGELARELLLNCSPDDERGVTIQTPGGTGALRVAAEFAARKLGAETIWCSQPTWVNHANIFVEAGLAVKNYRYLDASGSDLDLDGMLDDLGQASAGDVVCLHGCCHNPTGVDPTTDQWAAIADRLKQKGLLPLVDCAYQGFGSGLDEDAAGVRRIHETVPELIACASFSKNFGLYGERVGALTVMAADAGAARAALSHVKACVRANYSNPPKHGAAIVATVLGDAELRAQWMQELAGMRDRINGMRAMFVETLKSLGVKRDFSFIKNQRGMFSFSGLSRLHVDQLRNEHSIYVVGSGRINVAGMTESNMGRLCEAIKTVLAE